MPIIFHCTVPGPDSFRKNAGSQATPRRRIMRALKINEVSAVDVPAQEGAVAVILKRKGSPGYDPKAKDPRKRGRFSFQTDDIAKGGDLVDLFTDDEDGHQHGIRLMHSDGDGISLIVSFAKGPEDEMPHDHQVVQAGNGDYVMGMNDGHSHDIDQNAMREAIFRFMTKSAEELDADETSLLGKQGPSRAVRERLAETGEALPDGSFPIRNRGDLRNAIQAFGRARQEDRRKVANHIRRRARALDAAEMLPDEGVLADLLKAADDVGTKEEDAMTDKTKKADGEPTVEGLQAQLARATQLASLNDAQKAHLATLDEAAQDAFLAKSSEERDAEIEATAKRAAEADPVVYKTMDGVELRKSAGDAVIALAKSNDALRKKLEESEAKVEDASYAKRADDELKHLPGTTEERAAMLKAIDGIEDESQRKAAMNALKAQNEALAPAFTTVGHLVGKVAPGSPEEGLQDLAKRIQAESDGKLSYEQAYSKALETDEGSTLYAKSVN